MKSLLVSCACFGLVTLAFGCSDDAEEGTNAKGGSGALGTAGNAGRLSNGGVPSTAGRGSAAAGASVVGGGSSSVPTTSSAGSTSVASAGALSTGGSSAAAGAVVTAGAGGTASIGGASANAGVSAHTGISGGGQTASTGGASAGTSASLAAAGAAIAGASASHAGANAGGATSQLGVAGTAGVAGSSSFCDYGTAASLATNQTLNLFGEVVYFADGAPLPSGRYRVSYQDGCMKYSSTQGWTVHAYANGATAAWWLVGATSSDHVAVPPGTVGYSTSNGAFATFDECVAANKTLAPTEFDFAGGKLGVYLLDSNYPDNIAGDNGRNPKWQLSLLSPCGTAGAASAAGASSNP